jgi:hypothetical protein
MAIDTADRTRYGWHGGEQVPVFPCLYTQTAKHTEGGAIANYGLDRVPYIRDAMDEARQGSGYIRSVG